MNPIVRTFGLIFSCSLASYITLTAMLQDPNKPYRGHINIRKK